MSCTFASEEIYEHDSIDEARFEAVLATQGRDGLSYGVQNHTRSTYE